MNIFQYLREFNFVSVCVRLLLAVLLSGAVGIERERHGKAAGLRTHILVCLGAAMASMTGIFISKEYGADVSRIAAQVVSGIGFLGAGTILVRIRSTVTGLTTAASIWATGALGLAVGFGFYGAAILCALLMLFIAGLLGNVDRRLSRRPRELNVYAEFSDSSRLNETLDRFGEAGFEVLNIHLTSPKTNLPAGVGADMVIRLNRRLGAKEAVDMLRKTENVHLIIEE